jgi:hypothetical protein
MGVRGVLRDHGRDHAHLVKTPYKGLHRTQPPGTVTTPDNGATLTNNYH